MRLISDISTPALVLGSAHHGGLAATRTLGRLGIATYSVDASAWAPSAASKYCRQAFAWDPDLRSPEESMAFFLAIRKSIGKPMVLVPMTDVWTLFLADHADELRDYFLFSPQDAALVRTLHDKRAMNDLAQQHGVATPLTMGASTIRKLYEFAENTDLPVMFKASDGLEVARRGLPTKVIVENRNDLFRILEMVTLADLPYIMLQEFIPGDPSSVWMFEGYFDMNSNCRFAITGRKLRQYPAYTGASSLAICEQNDTVSAILSSFLQRIGYQGPVDAELRFDDRTGTYKVLDINCRAGGTFRLFTDQRGMDIVRVLYCGLTGQPIGIAEPCWGRRWMVEDSDAIASIRYCMDGKLTIGDWWRSLKGIDEGAVFSRDDWAGSLAVLRADLINAAGMLRVSSRGLRKGQQYSTAHVTNYSNRRIL